MTPAFSSTRQAAAFALLLAVLLSLPALVAKTHWLDRRDVYPSIPWQYGPYQWIQEKIFTETNDADIVFLGSSHIWSGVDAPFVQKKMSAWLGRPAEVFTLGWPWAGNDASYIFARDLLEHRHVRMLVIYDEDRNEDGGSTDQPHLHSSHWFRIGENSEALAGLPRLAQISLYGDAVLGMPRHLLSVARPNPIEAPTKTRGTYWEIHYHVPNIARQLGALRLRTSYERNDFIPRAPGSATPADTVVYSAANADRFAFAGRGTTPYQLHFACKLARLCQEHGTRLVMLHLPELSESTRAKIPERVCWPEVLGAPVTLLGVAGASLFAGIPPDNVPDYFFNRTHLNQNGADLFTSVITPALLELYAGSSK